MVREQLPDELLSLVYATASDAGAWQAFCDAMTQHTGAATMLFGHNLGTDESLGILAGGLDPAELERYHAHFADKNPWMHMNATMPAGSVGVSDQALERDDLFRTEFYNDWLRKQENVVAGPFMMCHRTQDTFVGLAAACRARTVDKTLPAGLDLFQALAPHLNRAIGLAGTLRANGGHYDHLDASPQAILLLRRSGRVGFANQAALNFLERTAIMRLSSREKLQSGNARIGAFLAKSLNAIAFQDFAGLPAPLSWSESHSERGVMYAHIFPQRAALAFPQSAWMDPIAGAIIVTGANGLKCGKSCGALALALGATPAETRLAVALMDGETLNGYADAHGLSVHTVRNQLRALLHKTGTKGQSDLVRYFLRLMSPFKAH